MNIDRYLIERTGGLSEKRVRLLNSDFAIIRFTNLLTDCLTVKGFNRAGNYEYEIPPFAVKFCSIPTKNNVVALANEDGDILFFDTLKRLDKSVLQSFRGHNNAIFDLCWMDGEYRLASVSGDQTAVIWDCETQKSINILKGHSGSVKTVDFRPNDNFVLSTGGRDGNIFVWDTRAVSSAKAESCIRNAHTPMNHNVVCTPKLNRMKIGSGEYLPSVTVNLFQTENYLFSSGAADGLIKVWDTRKNYSLFKNEPIPVHSFPYQGNSIKKHGYSSLTFDSSKTRLYANCTDNIIYAFDCCSCSPDPIARYFGHVNATFFVKSCLSGDDNYILSGSSDEFAYIWNVKKEGDPIYKLTGHAAEVTSVAWNPVDLTMALTCCDDLQLRMWRVQHVLPDDTPYLRGQAEPCPKSTLIPAALAAPATASKSIPLQVTPLSNLSPSSVKIVKRKLAASCENIKSLKRGKPKRVSPVKRSPLSPRKLFGNNIISPTVDLPNFVLDSKSHHCFRSADRVKKTKTPDWLTSLSCKKKQPMGELPRDSETTPKASLEKLTPGLLVSKKKVKKAKKADSPRITAFLSKLNETVDL